MDQTCRTCNYWRRPRVDYPDRLDPDAKGLCVNIRGSGFHRSDKAEPRVWEPPLLLRITNSRLTLELHTSPDFGCNEWQPFIPD